MKKEFDRVRSINAFLAASYCIGIGYILGGIKDGSLLPSTDIKSRRNISALAMTPLALFSAYRIYTDDCLLIRGLSSLFSDYLF